MKKRLCVVYLYADGHGVLIYQKRDPDAGDVEFAEVHERLTEARLDFAGRLVFGQYECSGFLRLARMAKVISAREPGLNHGSENSRKLGIPIGGLDFVFTGNSFYEGDFVHFTSAPSVISAGYNYQPECEEKFDPGISRWCNTRVAKVHRVPVKAEQQAAA